MALMVYSKKYLRRIVDDWINEAVEATLDGKRVSSVMISLRGAPERATNNTSMTEENIRALVSSLSSQKNKALSHAHSVLSIAICIVELCAVILSVSWPQP